MIYKKIYPLCSINLQNGMYCHVLENYFVIKDESSLYESDVEPKLNKSRNLRVIRLFLNVFFSLCVFAFALYSEFYPIALLLFVSLWDLRQIQRYRLPINLSACIPIKNIKEIKLIKGRLGFNFMEIIIENEGKLTLKLLQLYDSESTFELAKNVAQNTGKLTTVHEPVSIPVEGEKFSLNEVDAYILKDKTLYLCHKNFHQTDKNDSYLYLRYLSWFLIFIGISAFGVKIYLMLNNYSNYVDFLVLLFLASLLIIPLKYTQKALPNLIEQKNIVGIEENKKNYLLVLKANNNWKLKVYFPKQKLGKQNLNQLL